MNTESEISDKEPIQETVCLIPSYNEEETVGRIAQEAARHPDISRVVVIDDGSIDRTSEVAGSISGVEVIRLEKNCGKGAAMKAGFSATSEPVVLFLDADLMGLSKGNITNLLKPVLENEVDMSVGIFRGGRVFTDLAHVVAPSLSGQRAVSRSVFDYLDVESTGFEIERALTELWETGAIRVKKVKLHGVTHRTKEEKRGFMEGVKQRLGMFLDIINFERDRLKRRMKARTDNLESYTIEE